jgi:hypothetical protein
MVYDDAEARAMVVEALAEKPGELIAAMEVTDDLLTRRES